MNTAFRRKKLEKKGSFLIIAGLLVLLALFAGCTKPPAEEMDAAAEAVSRAERDTDAALYGASSLNRARQSLNTMQEEAAAKRYDSAKTYAAEAISAAERAIADGKAGAQRTRDETVNLIAGLRNTAAETEQNLEAAKRVPGIQLDFYTLSNDLDTAKDLTGQAQTALSGNNYQDAVNKGEAARSLLGDITTRISQASIATSRKK
jgi:hypothetical protein